MEYESDLWTPNSPYQSLRSGQREVKGGGWLCGKLMPNTADRFQLLEDIDASVEYRSKGIGSTTPVSRALVIRSLGIIFMGLYTVEMALPVST